MEELIEILRGIKMNVDFSMEKHLVEDGVLDSLDIVAIIGKISEKFNVTLTGDDIDPDNFESVENIWKMIQYKVK